MDHFQNIQRLGGIIDLGKEFILAIKDGRGSIEHNIRCKFASPLIYQRFKLITVRAGIREVLGNLDHIGVSGFYWNIEGNIVRPLFILKTIAQCP